ncbi:MAG: ABC transporter ATP-binding protein [Micromonosporaceae bacterium]|nr:ABC transporter ATP-binding protein [Micromonosporaceae bacterium]
MRALWLLLGLGFRAAPGLMWTMVARTVVASLASAGYPLGYRILVDGALRGDGTALAAGGGIVAVLFCTTWLLGVLRAVRSGVLTDHVNLYLGERIGAAVAKAPGLAHFETPADLAELDQLRDNRRVLAGAPVQLLGGLQIGVVAVATVGLLASVYPPVLLVPLLAVVPWLADRRAAAVQRRSDDELAEPKRLAGELFGFATTAASAKELRTYGVTGTVAARHARLSELVRAGSVRAAVRGACWEGLGWLGYAAGFVAAIIVLVLRAVHGLATPGQVVMAVSLVRRAQTQVSRTTDTAGSLGTSLRTARQLLSVEARLAPARAPAGVRVAVPPRLVHGIRLRGVSFAYPSAEKSTLEDVDLDLPAGSTVALVGENGAGKTTLVKLLTAMYQPTSGQILVDGADLSTMDPAAWRERTRGAFQDFVRFQLTAGEVVGVGDLPRLDDAESVHRALRRAGADGLLDRLPDGLDTLLGRYFTGGQELSGGQWQRLALARGMMRTGPLLTVLDEPTASLDALAEAALFERYAQAAREIDGGAITLLVSHRFSTVAAAQLIVVLEQGRVVEVGSHEQLLARGGLYAQLLTLQAQGYRRD